MVTLSPISHCYLNSFGWEKKNLKQKIVKYLLFLWNKIKSNWTQTHSTRICMHAHNCKQIRNPHIHQKIKLIHAAPRVRLLVGRSLGGSFGVPYTFIPYIHVYEYISIYSIQNTHFRTKTHTHTHTYICIYTHFFELRYSQISTDQTEIYFSGTVLNQYFFLTCQQQHTFVWFIHDIQGYRVSQNNCGIRKFFCVNTCYILHWLQKKPKKIQFSQKL